MMKTEPAADQADVILPHGVAKFLRKSDCADRHPGLQLDKLSPPGNQESQRKAVEAVCTCATDPRLLAELSHRRNLMLENAGAERFRATTTGPLTLHLARASGLENAGIHLHALYGFACLPASGIKGVARAYAETVWLDDQEDPTAAWDNIRAVFGWAAGSEKSKGWKPDGACVPEGSRAGAVVFHDAWPTAWPCLQPDIVNNHHVGYYEGEDDPADWDDPNMAFFLSVVAGTVFDFAVSARSGANRELLPLALTWLQAALVYEGIGAKTNAGYGRFRLEGQPIPARPVVARCIATHTLTLATPAFLAGAQQQEDDCDLRPATLRGLLRWWWRTMHAAHLGREELLGLETATWGDAQHSAALGLSVQNVERPAVTLFNYKGGSRPYHGFAKEHALEEPGRGTTQGLFYAAYGMDEKKGQRWYVEPEAHWAVTLSARRGVLQKDGSLINAADVLRQGEAALWLLCRFGGVGSKARKGFGSFADIDVAGIAEIEDCKRHSAIFRHAFGFPAQPRLSVGSSNLEDMLPLEVRTPWRDYWFAIDQLGFAAQTFARKNAHKERKAALGLPRKIHGPRKDPMGHQDRDRHQQPKSLSADGHYRYASPVHYHLAPHSDGTLTVRTVAFPSPNLRNIEESTTVLQELMEHLQIELEERKRRHVGRGTKKPKRIASSRVTGVSPLPKLRERVGAILLEEKTKKGGWKAKHEGSGLQGHIHNTQDIPGDAKPGQRMNLFVKSVNPNKIEFWWPTPEIEAQLSRVGDRGARQGMQDKRPQRRRQ